MRKSIAPGQLLIDGKWRNATSGETTTTTDPTTEARLPAHDLERIVVARLVEWLGTVADVVTMLQPDADADAERIVAARHRAATMVEVLTSGTAADQLRLLPPSLGQRARIPPGRDARSRAEKIRNAWCRLADSNC